MSMDKSDVALMSTKVLMLLCIQSFNPEVAETFRVWRTIPVRNVTGHLLRSERTDGRHNAAASRTYTCPKTSIRREDRTMCAIPSLSYIQLALISHSAGHAPTICLLWRSTVHPRHTSMEHGWPARQKRNALNFNGGGQVIIALLRLNDDPGELTA